jgi:hypothetical protein
VNDDGPDQSSIKGKRLIAAAWQSTAVFLLVLLAGVVRLDLFGVAVVIVSVAMFALGVLLLAIAFALGIKRSRAEEISVAGLFLLQGSSPPVVRKVLIASVLTQLTAALVASGLRIYTEIAFAILAPTFVFGLASVWAGRYGSFPPRTSDSV